MNKSLSVLKKSSRDIGYLILYYCFFWLPDKVYLKAMFRNQMGKRLNLANPRTLCEKLQWLKLYDRNPLYTQMVDKSAVKALVSKRIGEKFVIQPIAVWDSVEDINWEILPEKFVLKCTHDSGSIVICRDKKTLNKDNAKKILRTGLKQDYFLAHREWPYKDVPRRVIAEPFIEGLGSLDSTEYKLTCMNGEVKIITVCGGIAHSSFDVRTNDHFSKAWERQSWYVNYKPSGKDIQKPPFMDEMIMLSEKLAQGIPYVRVDWYELNGQLYFGEFTFFTWAGFMHFEPKVWDEILGDWLQLPESKRIVCGSSF